jgi:hypothetical protein
VRCSVAYGWLILCLVGKCAVCRAVWSEVVRGGKKDLQFRKVGGGVLVETIKSCTLHEIIVYGMPDL